MNEYISRVKFKDIFENYNVFDAEFELSGFKDATNLTAANAQIMFSVLYAKYCNSTLASIDSLRFKAQFFSMIFQYAPAWQKKLAIQNIIYAMDEDDVTILNENVFNSAQNPSTAPSTDAFTPLSKIDTQNATRTKRNALSGWAQLRDLVESDFTNEFVKKFQRLFIVIVEDPCDYPPILKIRGNKIYAGEVLPGIGYPYEHGDIFIDTLTKKIYQYDSVYGEPQWAFIVDVSASISPTSLLDTLEGSDYISVDMNEAGTKVVVELDETKLEADEATEDSDKLITSGAVFNGLGDKQDKLTDTQISNINRALVSPVATSTEKRIVAVDENNNQVQVKIGENLTLEGSTSPYTLKASGGSGGGVSDVKIKSTSIVSGGIATIPYASTSNSGVIKTSSNHNTYVNLDNGILSTNETSLTAYNSMSNYGFIGKGMLENVLTAKGIGGWTLLWENASPSSQFASQTLSLDTTNYSKLAIVLYGDVTIIIDKSSIVSGKIPRLTYMSNDDSDSMDIYIRKITTLNNSQIIFDNCKHTIIDADSISKSNANGFCVPYKVYGFN